MRIPTLALAVLLSALTTRAALAQVLGPEHVAGWKWRLIGPSNPAGRAWRLTGSPGEPKILYVTTAAGGLWKTINNGTTFEPIFDGYGSGSTSVLAVAPSDPDILWLGTGEAANTHTIEEMNGDMFFRGENPEYGTLISYHLKADVDAVSIEIRDSEGTLLRHMTGPAGRGLQRVNWDLLPDGAGQLARRGRETPEERAFARQVPVGSYTVRVTAGAASMSRPVVVRSEPQGPRQVQVRR